MAREAAFICGEIVRHATGFQWIVDDAGEWFLTPGDAGSVVWPYARLRELEFSGLGGGERVASRPGIHTLFVQQATFDALDDVLETDLPKARSLLDGSSLNFDFLSRVEALVKRGRCLPPASDRSRK